MTRKFKTEPVSSDEFEGLQDELWERVKKSHGDDWERACLRADQILIEWWCRGQKVKL